MSRLTTAAQVAKLKAQIRKLEEKEKAIDARKQKKALTQIAALARSSELTIGQIQAALAKRARGGKRAPAAKRVKTGKSGSKLAGRKVAPKYRNPANNAETWAGRGRAPKWAADLKAAGKLDTALIR